MNVPSSRRFINSKDDYLTIQLIDESNLVDHIPPRCYRPCFDDNGNLILVKERLNFTLPQKIYGEHTKYFSRITASYDPSGRPLGVMLTGDPGTGKSLLAEAIGNWMINRDLPVMLITDAMSGNTLDRIATLVGPCMFYFDEFEKVYNEKAKAESILTFLSSTKHEGILSLVAMNEVEDLPEALFNRPQRFLYCIKYDTGLTQSAVMEIMDFMKIPEQFHAAFVEYGKFGNINYDAFLHVVRASAGLKTIEEIREYCSILNVPDFPRESISILKLVIDEDRFADFENRPQQKIEVKIGMMYESDTPGEPATVSLSVTTESMIEVQDMLGGEMKTVYKKDPDGTPAVTSRETVALDDKGAAVHTIDTAIGKVDVHLGKSFSRAPVKTLLIGTPYSQDEKEVAKNRSTFSRNAFEFSPEEMQQIGRGMRRDPTTELSFSHTLISPVTPPSGS